MFKAKLIENESYYTLKGKQLLLLILPSVAIVVLVNFNEIPIWLTITMIASYIMAIILMVINQKRIKSIFGNKLIEIDVNEIRIKSKVGIQQEIIKLDELEKIILKEEYSFPQETIKEVSKELTGKTKKNYLIIQKNNQKRKLDFEVDSYYMMNQLNEIIDSWKANGYNIEKLKHE